MSIEDAWARADITMFTLIDLKTHHIFFQSSRHSNFYSKNETTSLLTILISTSLADRSTMNVYFH